MENHKDIFINIAGISKLDSLVNLHMSCFLPDDNIAIQFGEDFVRAAYRWFLTSPETCVLIATKDNKLAGAISICDRPYSLPMLMACKKEAMISIMKNPMLLFNVDLLHRFISIVLGRKKRNKNAASGAQIAFTMVAKDYRRQGLAIKLRNAAISISRERGHGELHTVIRRENIAMRRVSEQSGFFYIDELSDKSYVHMAKNLLNT